jgi:hypothetical protein
VHINCAGSGTPTIIYMHGTIEDPTTMAHRNGTAFGIAHFRVLEAGAAHIDEEPAIPNDITDALRDVIIESNAECFPWTCLPVTTWPRSTYRRCTCAA